MILYYVTIFFVYVTSRYREHCGALRAQDKIRKHGPLQGSVFYGFKDNIINTDERNLFSLYSLRKLHF